MQEIMTPKEVAQYLKMSILTVYKYAKQGIIPGSRIGNSWRFDKAHIDEVRIKLGSGLEKNPQPAATKAQKSLCVVPAAGMLPETMPWHEPISE